MGLFQSKSDGDVADTEEYTWVNDRIKEYPVLIFSKTTCPYCAQTKKLFEKNNTSYHALEINNMGNCAQIQDVLHYITGARTVPRVFINGISVGGCDDVKQLNSSGKLMELIDNVKHKELSAGES